jgi:phosphoglycolate phosphatase-like HAD superfamily hydrolase
VLGSLSSLRDVAFRVSGSSLLAPASASAGSAQSGPIKSASAGESYRAAEDMSEIDKARRQLVNATAKLAPWQMQLSAASQQTAAQVSACQVQVPAGSLQVDPDDTELSLGKGQQQVFYVLGGSGVPVGTVTGKGGAAADALVRDIDAQGRFRFTYKAGDAAKPGDELQIRFSDAAGQSAPRITLHILDAATGNKAGSVTDAAVEAAKRAPADDWVALGFASKDDNKANDFVTLVLKCQGMLGATVTAADGQMNEPVRKALKEGRCEKAPPK